MEIDRREFTIEKNAEKKLELKNTKTNKIETWRRMVSGLTSGKMVELVFNYSVSDNSDVNSDPFSDLLEFALYSILAFHIDKKGERVRKIILRVNAFGEKKIKEISRFANYFKFLYVANRGRFEIQIGSSRNIFLSGKYFSNQSHAFIPAYPLDQTLYDFYFKTTLEDFLAKHKESFEGCTFADYIDNSTLCFQRFIICFIRETLLPKDKASQIRAELNNWINSTASELTIFEALLCAVYYEKWRKKQTKRIKPGDPTTMLSVGIKHMKVIAHGVREICENILKHTTAYPESSYLGEQLGMLYFRIHEDRSKDDLNLESDYWEDSRDWFEISVLDFGQEGILDTYERDMTERVPIHRMYTNLDMTDVASRIKNFDSGNQKEKDIKALLFGIGLKVFQNIVSEYDGYFAVQTTEKRSNTINYQKYHIGRGLNRNFAIHEEEPCVSIGTKYRIFLPISKVDKLTDISANPIVVVPSDMRAVIQNINYYEKVNKYLDDNIITRINWTESEVEGVERLHPKEIPSKVTKLISEKYIESWKEAAIIDFSLLVSPISTATEKMLLYYLLYSFAGEHNCEYVIFVGLPKNIVENFKASYIEQLYAVKPILHKKSPWILLFNTEGDPYILKGLDKSQNIAYINYYHRYRLQNFIANPDVIEYTGKEMLTLLPPVEVIPSSGTESPAFFSHVKKLLKNSFEGKEFGARHDKHVKLGSKTHMDSFFQAEFLFANSYYTDCFAYVLAKDIDIDFKDKEDINICLVGYKNYSKMLVETVKRILQYQQKYKSVETVIYHDAKIHFKEEFKKVQNNCTEYAYVFIVPISASLKTFNKIYSDFIRRIREAIKDDTYNFSTKPVNYCLIEIRDNSDFVEGETITKEEKKFGWIDVQKNKIIMQHDFPFNNGGDVQEVKYFISESAKWHSAIDCPVCEKNEKLLFETHDSSLILRDNQGSPHVVKKESFLSAPQKEKIQNSFFEELSNHMAYGHITRFGSEFNYYFDTVGFFAQCIKDSALEEELKEWAEDIKGTLFPAARNQLKSSMQLDLWAKDFRVEFFEQLKADKKLAKEMDNFISNFRVMLFCDDDNDKLTEAIDNWAATFRTRPFVKDNEELAEKINILVSSLKCKLGLQEDRCVNILLVPDHFSNVLFVEWVFDKIFQREGLIIREDFSKVFYSDFREKYRSVRNWQNVKLFFCDDAIVSGRSFSQSFKLAKELRNDAKNLEITIITLASRLDYTNFGTLSNSYSEQHVFFEVCVPAIHRDSGMCWLCEQKSDLKKIKKQTPDYKFQEFIDNVLEKKYLNKVDVNIGHQEAGSYFENGEKPQIKQRFLIANKIFLEISNLDQERIKAEEVYKILGLSREGNSFNENILGAPNIGTSYRMNLIRCLSISPLCNFIIVREVAHKLAINELGEVLKKSDDPLAKKYLIYLVELLAILNSSYILQKNNIEPIYNALHEDNFLYRYRCAIQKLCYNDQTMEYLLIKHCLELLDTNHDRFKSFLEWAILENNNIIRSAKESFAHDIEGISTDTDAEDKHKLLENYYYETFREMWLRFADAQEVDEPMLKEQERILRVLTTCNHDTDFDSDVKDILGEIKHCHKCTRIIEGTIVPLEHYDAKVVSAFDGENKSNDFCECCNNYVARLRSRSNPTSEVYWLTVPLRSAPKISLLYQKFIQSIDCMKMNKFAEKQVHIPHDLGDAVNKLPEKG